MVAIAEKPGLKELYQTKRLEHAVSHRLSAIEETERARAAVFLRLPVNEKPSVKPPVPNEALEKNLDKLHRQANERYGGNRRQEAQKEEWQRIAALRKAGIIPSQNVKKAEFKNVGLPFAQDVWKKSGDNKILLKPEPLSAVDVNNIIANAPARQAAALDPAIQKNHQKRKDMFAYYLCLKKTRTNREHKTKTEPKVTLVRPTDKNRQPRLF